MSQSFDRFEPPDGWKFDTFKNADGKDVRYGHVKPKGETKGTVVMTTGYADFIESYYETIHDYLDRGFEVWMMDWAGQGGSERYDKKKPWLPNPNSFFDNIRDLHDFRHNVVKHDDAKPIFYSTHSMGGHIGLHSLAKHKGDFDFAVLAAPLADFDIPPAKRYLIEKFTRAATKLGLGNKVMQRRRVVTKIKKDREKHLKDEPIRMRIHKIYAQKNPELRVGDPTIASTHSTFKAVRKLNEPHNLASISTPVLIGLAENDRLVNNEATKRSVKQIPSAEYKLIKDANHALWTEREKIRARWWDTVDEFVDRQVAAFHAGKKPAPQNTSAKNRRHNGPKP